MTDARDVLLHGARVLLFSTNNFEGEWPTDEETIAFLRTFTTDKNLAEDRLVEQMARDLDFVAELYNDYSTQITPVQCFMLLRRVIESLYKRSNLGKACWAREFLYLFCLIERGICNGLVFGNNDIKRELAGYFGRMRRLVKDKGDQPLNNYLDKNNLKDSISKTIRTNVFVRLGYKKEFVCEWVINLNLKSSFFNEPQFYISHTFNTNEFYGEYTDAGEKAYHMVGDVVFKNDKPTCRQFDDCENTQEYFKWLLETTRLFGKEAFILNKRIREYQDSAACRFYDRFEDCTKGYLSYCDEFLEKNKGKYGKIKLGFVWDDAKGDWADEVFWLTDKSEQ